jgi:tetratricopeptide (TPR) repeat protein
MDPCLHYDVVQAPILQPERSTVNDGMRLLLILNFLAPLALPAQHLTHREWLQQSFIDMRLAPAYGGRVKNAEQLSSDSAFIAQMLSVNPDRHACAEHLVDLGNDLLAKGDMVQAMYRFNHAYLMEPGNARIRRSYGAFFLALDRTAEAAAEYQKGLALDSANVPLMVDMASVCLIEHYGAKGTDVPSADQFLRTAIALLERAVALEPENATAHFKLSAAMMNDGDCVEAWEHYRNALTLDAESITGGFAATLEKACPPTR